MKAEFPNLPHLGGCRNASRSQHGRELRSALGWAGRKRSGTSLRRRAAIQAEVTTRSFHFPRALSNAKNQQQVLTKPSWSWWNKQSPKPLLQDEGILQPGTADEPAAFFVRLQSFPLLPFCFCISVLPSPALRFACFSFTSFCRSRLRQGVCCLPDAKMDYWINSSAGCLALQRLEVREVINSHTSPFAHWEGAGAIDLADSLGSCSHTKACISAGSKSVYIFWCLLLSNEKEMYAIL